MCKNRFLFKSLIGMGMYVGVIIAIPVQSDACTTVLVGKDASADGSTMIARNEDMSTAWAKHFVVREKNTNVSHFVSKSNNFTIELPKEHLKYTATPEWDTSKGLFEEDGINSKNVGMSATESATTKEKVLKLDPFVDNGIAEDSMLTVVLPYINTPIEGIQRLGKIIEEKGAAEANGVIFSNKNEIWYMEILSGHQWVAVKVPDDKYAVIANTLSIDKVNLNDTERVMCSSELKNFIKKNNLGDVKKEISIKKIFADKEKDAQYNTPRVWDGQRMLTPSKKKEVNGHDFNLFEKPDKKITIAKVAYIMTLHFNGTKYDSIEGSEPNKYRPISVPNTMESHILQFRNNVPDEISGIHWLSLGIPDTSNYIPFYSGISDTPEMYKKGSDVPDQQSAYWIYRLTNVLTRGDYSTLKPKRTLPLRQEINKYMFTELAKSDNEAKEILNTNPEKLVDFFNEKANLLSNYSIQKYKELNKKLIVDLTNKDSKQHDKDL
ncbi:C69 family dipeptidase [Enterococcus faecalis]